jgi:hypothetical protein
MARQFFLVVCLSLGACRKAPTAQPRFCDQDLSGLWVNSSDKSFAYTFRDDGALIRGEFAVRAEDGGLTKPSEPITLEMKRADAAIAGVMRSRDKTAGGKSCPVEYELKVSDCKPDVLQVVAEVSAPVGDDCKRLSAADGGAFPPDLREFRLERLR